LRRLVISRIRRLLRLRQHPKLVAQWLAVALCAGLLLWGASLLLLRHEQGRLDTLAYAALQRDLFAVAGGGTLFLLLCTMTGLGLSARLISRTRRQREVQRVYRMATEAARDGFFMVRPLRNEAGDIVDFVLEDCNERGAAFYGATPAQLIGSRFSDSSSGAALESVLQLYRDALAAGYHEGEAQVPPENPLRPAWIHRRIVRAGDGLAVTLRDISDSKAQEAALAQMANSDAVTHLPNRHWLMRYLPDAVRRARAAQARLALLFIDLDDFKNINDTLGHATGDELLRQVALRLRTVVRPHDSVVRLGGDEFTIVLEHVGTDDDVAQIADRVLAALGEPFTLGARGGYSVPGTIGISIFPRDGEDDQTLLKHADVAMYAAKAAGKGHYLFYAPHLSATLVARMNREQLLRQAIADGEFMLYFQPRVDTRSGAMRAMEALLRWRHPERGVVGPQEFIALAEDTGLIVPLGRQVIDLACGQLAQWRRQGLPLVPVSINISARQFDKGRLSAYIAAAMARYGIEAGLLEIEVTESCMIGDDLGAHSELRALETLGVALLVDDFGTGYSSLSQLQRLDFDGIKVDRSFTAQLGQGAEGELLFRAILSMAQVLDMTVVAEGVETEQQLTLLQALGCHQVQGYLLARPQPASEMPALLRASSLLPFGREAPLPAG